MTTLLANATTQPTDAVFWPAFLGVAAAMLIWDTVEVGRNDAANLVNAVFGARIMQRRMAVAIAGVCVVLGAVLSSPVMETARKGIFHTNMLSLEQLLAIYISVYVVDTVLLYGYSSFGMPVSTTACLVFELLGASFAMKFFAVVNWSNSGKVVFAIIFSILLTGFMAFLIQRAVRGAIRDKATHLTTLLLHGGWVGGGMLAGLSYFMLLKGMKSVPWVKHLQNDVLQDVAPSVIVVVLWGVFAIIIHSVLVIFRHRAARWLFPVLTVLGMMCMAFAFGQNDLANCASPGLATINLYEHRFETVAIATEIPIPKLYLFFCGLLLVVGMATRQAQRVTRAEVNTGSMGDHVRLWAPNWCIALAAWAMRFRRGGPALAPMAVPSSRGKITHYDTLRACVIMSVSASVIATASSLGMPVSTTYVAFAAVVATGMADRIFQRGDAALKLGRAIWVVFSWFAAAVIAAIVAGIICRIIYHLGPVGMLLVLATNLAIRRYLGRRADAQEARLQQEHAERVHPEDFALEVE